MLKQQNDDMIISQHMFIRYVHNVRIHDTCIHYESIHDICVYDVSTFLYLF